MSAPKYLALGVFDGLHLGHQRLIAECVSEAHKAAGCAVVFTFRNHPLDVLAPAYAPKKLMLLSEKLALLKKLGVDVTVCIEFDQFFARLEPEEFVRRLLVERCGLQKLFCGYNFRFGRDAAGTVAHIRQLAGTLGFSFCVLPPVCVNGMIVSSSKIRELIDDGMVGLAATMLTRPYQLHGRVIRGAGRGRQLGFPTANLRIPREMLVPAEGVYAATVKRTGPKASGRAVTYGAMLYIGRRPTFGAQGLSIEAYLFDFHGNLLGETLRVAFLERLRGDQRFKTPAALVDQLRKDERAARRALRRLDDHPSPSER
jgi:riboflavin kinase/FMN adenylyltransferase